MSEQDILEQLRSIFVNRRGLSIDAEMITVSLINYYKPNTLFKFTSQNDLKIIENNIDKYNIDKIKKIYKIKNILHYITTKILKTEYIHIPNPNFTTPRFFTFERKYILDEHQTTNLKFNKIENKINNKNQNNNNNILGNNEKFIVKDLQKLTIPIEMATVEKLAYYNCFMLNPNEKFILEGEHSVGLFEMYIGKNYLNDYLLAEEYGNGLYLEKHNQPHYYNYLQIVENNYFNDEHYINDKNYGYNHNHLNRDKKIMFEQRGFLLLGKQNDDLSYSITGFIIPNNVGIYLPPNVLHCDGTLRGRYQVIYSKTDDYNTYLLHNEYNNILKLRIEL